MNLAEMEGRPRDCPATSIAAAPGGVRMLANDGRDGLSVRRLNPGCFPISQAQSFADFLRRIRRGDEPRPVRSFGVPASRVGGKASPAALYRGDYSTSTNSLNTKW